MERLEHSFPYEWLLMDGYPAKGIDYHGAKVFSCFSGGGGSTMGYKLAGFDVVGCCELDARMFEVYTANHAPDFGYCEAIQTFKQRDDLPPVLYDLDILDGSPPCSSFSAAGKKSKDWGKEKRFREGQAAQILDTLFFDFVELADKLQPKIVIAENVTGMLERPAQKYVSNVLTALDAAGYYADFAELNSAAMGVPQKRRRLFFFAIRKDLYNGPFGDLFETRPLLSLEFDGQPIPFSQIDSGIAKGPPVKPSALEILNRMGERAGKLYDYTDKEAFFTEWRLDSGKPCQTITANGNLYHPRFNRRLNDGEFSRASSFPLDFDYCESKPVYVMGMAVPPVMMAGIAHRVKRCWLDQLQGVANG